MQNKKKKKERNPGDRGDKEGKAGEHSLDLERQCWAQVCFSADMSYQPGEKMV